MLMDVDQPWSLYFQLVLPAPFLGQTQQSCDATGSSQRERGTIHQQANKQRREEPLVEKLGWQKGTVNF